MDIEKRFISHYNLMPLNMFAIVGRERKELDKKISNSTATKDDVRQRAVVELYLLQAANRKIIEERNLRRNIICIEVLGLFCKNIANIFSYMHKKFQIPRDLLLTLINICQDYAIYISLNDIGYLNDAVLAAETNLDLWIELLKFYINKKCYIQMMDTFNQAIDNLTNGGVESLCYSTVIYLRDKDPTKVALLCVFVPFNIISMDMRLIYFKWCMSSEQLSTVRNIFKRIQEVEPVSLKLYMAMIKYECYVDTIDVEEVRNLFSSACLKFGHNNIGIWLNAIRFEFTFGTTAKASELCSSSIICLEQHLRDNFIEEYEKIKNGINRAVIYDEVIAIDDD